MTRPRYLLALDQGTSSSRSIVFDSGGRIVAMAQREFRQIFPQTRLGRTRPDGNLVQPAWPRRRRRYAGAGIAAPTSPGSASPTSAKPRVVWNRRTASRCATPSSGRTGAPPRRAQGLLKKRGSPNMVRERTGLVIDAYFSGTKLAWILDNIARRPRRRRSRRARLRHRRQLAAWQLTGGAVHATDVSNASRTMLFDIHRNQWDDELLAMLDIPRAVSCPRCIPPATASANPCRPVRRTRIMPSAASPATSRPHCSARPASPRPGQEHLRHRLLHADAHR
jgi:glycerol kinase